MRQTQRGQSNLLARCAEDGFELRSGAECAEMFQNLRVKVLGSRSLILFGFWGVSSCDSPVTGRARCFLASGGEAKDAGLQMDHQMEITTK